ncbi:MAG TPA: radical SAM protein [Acidobacteriota bacterium]|nr:radical SAM protein [Acidobacteriota bacterium]
MTSFQDSSEEYRQFNRELEEFLSPLRELSDCTGCPRHCHADRTRDRLGYCGTGAGLAVGAICTHRGEEPVISGKHGICNVFFTGCNMRCTFCQNYQVSRPPVARDGGMDLYDVTSRIESILAGGATAVGFVSPSHVIPQVRIIAGALKARGLRPTFVFNSNAYDRVQTIASLGDVISVWLPDLKYMDDELAVSLSDAPDYPEVATAAIREMYQQTGPEIELDDDGIIRSGLIIRHLVVPGQVENSRAVLRWIAGELSPSVHVSLMSQYCPTPEVADDAVLGRTLHAEEYEAVMEEFDRLGFYRGWRQDPDSSAGYLPDFNRPHPFEDQA